MNTYMIDASGDGNNCAINALHGVVGANAMRRVLEKHGGSTYKQFRAEIATRILNDHVALNALRNQWELYKVYGRDVIETGYPEAMEMAPFEAVRDAVIYKIVHEDVMLSELEIGIATQIAEEAAGAGRRIFVLSHKEPIYTEKTIGRILKDQIAKYLPTGIALIAVIVNVGDHYYFLQRDDGSAWFSPQERTINIITDHRKPVYKAVSSSQTGTRRRSSNSRHEAELLKQIEKIQIKEDHALALSLNANSRRSYTNSAVARSLQAEETARAKQIKADSEFAKSLHAKR